MEKYFKEIVQHQHDLRSDLERKLQLTYEQYTAEVKSVSDVMHKLEALHRTSGTEASQLQRWLEYEKLRELIAQRSTLSNQIMENSTAIMIREARDELPADVRTADPAPPAKADEGGTLSLPLLKKKQEYLAGRLADIDADIEAQAKVIARTDDFNVNVQYKVEELEATNGSQPVCGTSWTT